MWCCQDVERKQKLHLSTALNAKRRDNVGIKRFPCQKRFPCHSCLNVSSHSTGNGRQTIRIFLCHSQPHAPYYDVAIPAGATAFIRDNLEHMTPNAMVTKIQEPYPNVTAAQVHSAWSKMSETLWKRHQDQLLSAKMLLGDFPDDVDVFEISTADGVQQLCFGMKRILEGLRGKIVEIGIDATCEFKASLLCKDLTYIVRLK